MQAQFLLFHLVLWAIGVGFSVWAVLTLIRAVVRISKALESASHSLEEIARSNAAHQ